MTLFGGYFGLLEFLRSVSYILPRAGKTFSFKMADLTQFFREIQRVEYFDSILARLLIEDLEKMTLQFEDQMKEIVTEEKYDCWCHKVFFYRSCEEYSNQSKLQLINFNKFAGFSNNQIKLWFLFSNVLLKIMIMCYKVFFLSSLNFINKYIYYF